MGLKKWTASLALVAGLAVPGASTLMAGDRWDDYRRDDRRDYRYDDRDRREDYRDIRRDSREIERMRAEVARDRMRLDEDMRCGRYREAEWDRLWRQFMPGQDLTTSPHRTRWMRQLHLFKHPFYYIDYALAETGALQLWQLAEIDQTRAINAFIRLCKLGGTKPLVGFFEDAGLKSPFTPGLLGPLMAKVMAGLELG